MCDFFFLQFHSILWDKLSPDMCYYMAHLDFRFEPEHYVDQVSQGCHHSRIMVYNLEGLLQKVGPSPNFCGYIDGERSRSMRVSWTLPQ